MDSKILLIEPFYGGSHKQLIDLLTKEISNCSLFTQTAKKWHWRARTSAIHFSSIIPKVHQYKILFCSSVLNLAELIALRPDLNGLQKIVYFHENQLVYPVRKQQDRDFQYGYNQILTCMVADIILFNSEFNMISFLNSIKTFFKLMPDYRPKNIKEQISPKCAVLYFPIEFPISPSDHSLCNSEQRENVLNIVWPHRWEHDKNPETFFETLDQLHTNNFEFNVFILGQSFSDYNDLFEKYKELLDKHIKHWGFLESKESYYELLRKCDVVVSTANHEFFGVAMLEATYCGCYPLCPNRLVYPEIFPAKHLYDSESDLLKRLEEFCSNPSLAKINHIDLNLEQYSWTNLKDSYMKLFEIN